MGMIAVGTLVLLFVIIVFYAYQTNKLNEIQEYLNATKQMAVNSISKLWGKKSVKFETPIQTEDSDEDEPEQQEQKYYQDEQDDQDE